MNEQISVARIHNFYRRSGGEDQTLAAEIAMLRQRGHRVERFFQHNSNIQEKGLFARASLAAKAVWNPASKKALTRFLLDHKIDIAHFHNTVPLLSPSAYYSAVDAGVPIVQTVHNYRTFCPAATLFRAGTICEACIGRRFAFPAVIYSCYRGDRFASFTQAATNAVHQIIGTYSSVIDAYICMTDFARQKAIAGGLPADRVHTKPHFVHPAPELGRGEGGFALYVGRLTSEKGWQTLTRAWRLARPKLTLRIIGDGPDRDAVQQVCNQSPQVIWNGWLAYRDIFAAMQEAAFLVFPSEWYETFGRVIVEAFACGTPVIATALGGHPEIVINEYNGLLFRPGDAYDLAAKITWFEENGTIAAVMRQNALHTFRTQYTAELNYAQLLEIYSAALARRGRHLSTRTRHY